MFISATPNMGLKQCFAFPPHAPRYSIVDTPQSCLWNFMFHLLTTALPILSCSIDSYHLNLSKSNSSTLFSSCHLSLNNRYSCFAHFCLYSQKISWCILTNYDSRIGSSNVANFSTLVNWQINKLADWRALLKSLPTMLSSWLGALLG